MEIAGNFNSTICDPHMHLAENIGRKADHLIRETKERLRESIFTGNDAEAFLLDHILQTLEQIVQLADMVVEAASTEKAKSRL